MRNKIFLGIGLLLLAAVASCGDAGTSGGSASGSGATQISDLSGIGRTPDTSWHDSYIVGAHSSFQCNDCHTSSARANALATSNDQICYQCHAQNYNSTSRLNHSQYKIGTYCNSCHYSDSFTSHSRVSHSEYHPAITSSCESCHSGRYPSSHAGGRTSGCDSCHQYSNGSWGVSTGGSHSYTSNCSSCHASRAPANHYGTTCENCHSYPSWSGSGHSYTSNCSSCHASRAPANHYGTACESCHSYPSWSGVSFNHSVVTSGCASCHSRHYAGYACEWCHTSGISWRFSHSRVNSAACNACHDGGHGDDGGDGHGDDDGGDDGHGDDD